MSNPLLLFLYLCGIHLLRFLCFFLSDYCGKNYPAEGFQSVKDKSSRRRLRILRMSGNAEHHGRIRRNRFKGNRSDTHRSRISFGKSSRYRTLNSEIARVSANICPAIRRTETIISKKAPLARCFPISSGGSKNISEKVCYTSEK